MRIYLASSWRNIYQPEVLKILREKGHEVYDFRNPTVEYINSNPDAQPFSWSEIDPLWRVKWSIKEYREALNHSLSRRGFNSDWEAMEWANTGVLLTPSGRSAHLEAGYFSGAGKELHILMMESQEPELMYKMATSISTSVEELLYNLKE